MIHARLTILMLTAGLVACGSSTENTALAGTYTATVLRATPPGQSTIDLLAGGSTLTITIGSNNSTTGSLTVPANLNGGVALNESMAGTAMRSGSTVEFQQSADTFVRDLTWTIGSNTLSVSSQVVAGTFWTVTLGK